MIFSERHTAAEKATAWLTEHNVSEEHIFNVVTALDALGYFPTPQPAPGGAVTFTLPEKPYVTSMPGYRCSEPGDMSGAYVPAETVDRLRAAARAVLDSDKEYDDACDFRASNTGPVEEVRRAVSHAIGLKIVASEKLQLALAELDAPK